MTWLLSRSLLTSRCRMLAAQQQQGIIIISRCSSLLSVLNGSSDELLLPTRPSRHYHQPQQLRCLSSSSASSSSKKRSTSKKSSSKKKSDSTSPPTSLRHLIRPFLLKCHPDAVQNYPDAKTVNLVAIQALNDFIDTMEGILMDDGSSSSSLSQQQKLRQVHHSDWPESVAIEFVLPIPDPMTARKKPKPPTLTRRRVELAYPPWQLRQQILQINTNNNNNLKNNTLDGDNNTTAAKMSRSHLRFQWMVQKELAKLVRTAGLAIPNDFIPAVPSSSVTSLTDMDDEAWRNFLMDDKQDIFSNDDDDEHSTTDTAFGRTRRFDASSYEHRQQQQRVIRHPPSKRERNRDAFVSRINWKRQDEAFEQAMRSVDEDWLTMGLISDNPTRKQQFVDRILARVRIQNKPPNDELDKKQKNRDENNDEEDLNHSDDDSDDDDDDQSISVLDQLVALRRLSLLLFDNFRELELEDMGKVWETMVIVLTPARDYNTSSSALNKRRKRRDYSPEDITNGFLFSYDTHNRITVHVPVDFTEQEFMEEFQSNLYDFSEMIEAQIKAEIYPADTFKSRE